MSEDWVEADVPLTPGVRDYAVTAGLALLVLAGLLWQEYLHWWALLPSLTGAVALLARWGSGPPMVLFLTTMALALRWRLTGIPSRLLPPTPSLAPVALAATLVAYVAAHMRLLSLTRHAVPPNRGRAQKPKGPRLAGRWFLPSAPTPRKKTAATEVLVLALVAMAAAGGAFVLWRTATEQRPPASVELAPRTWLFVQLVWAGAAALLLGNAIQAYFARAFATREANLAYLQDVAWEGTRREQREQRRWTAWFRRKRRAKEEGR